MGDGALVDDIPHLPFALLQRALNTTQQPMALFTAHCRGSIGLLRWNGTWSVKNKAINPTIQNRMLPLTSGPLL